MDNTCNLAVSRGKIRINFPAVINFQLLAVICTSIDFDSEAVPFAHGLYRI